MNKPDPRPVEQLIHQTLRSLPNRRAPVTLEGRVMQEIARRRALPWWQHSFSYWPTPMKIAFLAVSTVVAAGVVLLAFGLFKEASSVGWSEVAARPLAWLAQIRAVGANLGELVLRHLPGVSKYWIYGALAAFVGGYAVLFGVGAAAYQTLWKTR